MFNYQSKVFQLFLEVQKLFLLMSKTTFINCLDLKLYFALQGLSEYQRNFLWKKSYLSESYNPSVGRRYPWAGLRSDQLGKSSN